MARPMWLARPRGLTDANGAVPSSTGPLIKAIGARDLTIGAAMLTARTPSTRRNATTCGVAADWSDAAPFGTLLPDAERRLEVAGFAAARGALCAVARVMQRRR
ncbi:hypothetical protein AB0D60_29400 [Streptomyces sp. NPDC048306]|uniref:hypothetical protein n=1 Tax=Streptomyces sp. NPDC048306 TaxID=3154502 RepID=UPI0033E30D58